MNKKKILVMALVALTSLSGCGKKNSSSTSTYNAPKYQDPANPHAEISYEDKLASSSQDGLILHAFDWSFNDVKENLQTIKESGYTSVQLSPVQTPKQATAWMFLYQPVSFSIAEDGPLGTKDELVDLCSEAEKMGIKIICDIVANHMATTGKLGSDGFLEIDPKVGTYEPEIYNNQDLYFHKSKDLQGSDGVTQTYPGLPDLNTGNEYIQGRVASLLKECIDAGVDGFRFDAAKHIETSLDPNTKSNFWENTLGVAKDYYKTKTGNELYAYGEVLNDVEGGRDISVYSDMMSVTDNGYSSNVLSGVQSNKVEKTLLKYGKKTAANKLVLWPESHDTYLDGSTSKISKARIHRTWAILGSRSEATSLYFSRPLGSEVGVKGDNSYADKEVIAVNNFHNRFVGASEYLHDENGIFVNERFSTSDFGAVIVKTNGADSNDFVVKVDKIPEGTYYNSIDGSKVMVSHGYAYGSFPSEGIVCMTLTKAFVRPSIIISHESGIFAQDTTISLEVKNAQKASYSINGGEKVEFTNSTQVVLENSKYLDQNISLKVEVSNGNVTTTRVYNYYMLQVVEGYVNVINVKKDYIDNYDIYVWAWKTDKSSSWYGDEIYQIDGNRILVDTKDRGFEGFLLAIMPKGHVISSLTSWDNAVISQTGDIMADASVYDASNW